MLDGAFSGNGSVFDHCMFQPQGKASAISDQGNLIGNKLDDG